MFPLTRGTGNRTQGDECNRNRLIDTHTHTHTHRKDLPRPAPKASIVSFFIKVDTQGKAGTG